MIYGIIAQLDGKLFYYHSYTRMDKLDQYGRTGSIVFLKR